MKSLMIISKSVTVIAGILAFICLCLSAGTSDYYSMVEIGGDSGGIDIQFIIFGVALFAIALGARICTVQLEDLADELGIQN